MIKVAFFDAKAYDKPSFEHYGSEHDMQFRFLETKLNDDTVELARGRDAVCIFVNDTVNAAAIDKLVFPVGIPGGQTAAQTAAKNQDQVPSHIQVGFLPQN